MSKKKQNLKNQFIMIVSGGFFVGAYFIYQYVTVTAPKLEQESARKLKEVETQIVELRKLQQFSTNIENIKKELQELNIQLEAALEHMPRNFNLSGLLRKLSGVAENSGVTLSTFKPKKDEQKLGFYSSTTIDFEMKGSFTQTLMFLDQMSRLKRIVNIEVIRMTNPDRILASTKGATVMVSTQGTLKTYRFAE